MDEGPLGLTGEEADVLRRCADSEVTRRRIRQVILFASLFGALLLVVALLLRSWPFLLAVGLLYVGITALEKVAYGRAVLLYKSLARKLVRRVEELEERAGSAPPGGEPG
jgi:hypothetical protein